MKGLVYYNGIYAGFIEKTKEKTYVFEYDDNYLANTQTSAISLTLPKSSKRYTSEFLFPFFFNLLSEGDNKRIQCDHLKIDENDHFGLLLAVAKHDTIGAVRIVPNTQTEK